jgi:asparagine synthase (glutamine-hydrolysing)
MRFGSVQEPDTLIAGVRSLEPGSIVQYDGTEARESTFWSLPSGPARPRPREEAIEGIRRLLQESVRLRLVSDVPFGIFLSGGGDSSALAAIASAEASRPVHTFTVSFDEAALSEERQAADIASRFGCVHHAVRVTGADAGRDLPEALRAQDQPSGDGLNTWLVARAARREGLSMALSGLGGDEVFAGYPSFRRFGRMLRISRAASAAPSGILGFLAKRAARPGASNRFRKGVALAQANGNPEGVYEGLRCHFTDTQIERLMPGPAFRRIVADSTSNGRSAVGTNAVPVDDAVNALSRFELSHYLRSRLLRDTDSMSMSSSLEVRVPFLDHQLVEFVLSLPGESKLDRMVNKPLLFDAVPELPREIGARPKMGFVLPLPEWFRGPMKGAMEQLLLGLPGSSAGIFRRQSTTEAWQAFLRGDGTVSATRVFTIASLAAWTAEHDLILPW